MFMLVKTSPKISLERRETRQIAIKGIAIIVNYKSCQGTKNTLISQTLNVTSNLIDFQKKTQMKPQERFGVMEVQSTWISGVICRYACQSW